ncbi:hypothetical protein HDU99_009755 [Rhizoclosmatium hyalinum]|nr:hypothetical protein HDU99_009755 [Rhizoclosmatium hyalinum]
MKFLASALLASVVSAAGLIDTLTAANANTLIALVKTSPAVLSAVPTFNGTVFAPTDDALAAVVKAGFNASDITALTNVLTYHLSATAFSGASFDGTGFLATVQGNEVKASGSSAKGIQVSSAFGTPAANVVKTHQYDGGYVHVIDQVLIPPTNVVDTAKAANLTSLVNAIVTAGLADTVSKLSGVTILAPTNAAFDAIADVAKTLTVEQLKQVLLLHVLPGNIHSTDIVKAKSIPAAATSATGQTLNVTFDGTNVLASGAGNKAAAKVVVADVLADKVLVHVIDTVLLPGAAPAATTTAAKVGSASGAAIGVLSVLVAALVM